MHSKRYPRSYNLEGSCWSNSRNYGAQRSDYFGDTFLNSSINSPLSYGRSTNFGTCETTAPWNHAQSSCFSPLRFLTSPSVHFRDYSTSVTRKPSGFQSATFEYGDVSSLPSSYYKSPTSPTAYPQSTLSISSNSTFPSTLHSHSRSTAAYKRLIRRTDYSDYFRPLLQSRPMLRADYRPRSRAEREENSTSIIRERKQIKFREFNDNISRNQKRKLSWILPDENYPTLNRDFNDTGQQTYPEANDCAESVQQNLEQHFSHAIHPENSTDKDSPLLGNQQCNSLAYAESERRLMEPPSFNLHSEIRRKRSSQLPTDDVQLNNYILEEHGSDARELQAIPHTIDKEVNSESFKSHDTSTSDDTSNTALSTRVRHAKDNTSTTKSSSPRSRGEILSEKDTFLPTAPHIERPLRKREKPEQISGELKCAQQTPVSDTQYVSTKGKRKRPPIGQPVTDSQTGNDIRSKPNIHDAIELQTSDRTDKNVIKKSMANANKEIGSGNKVIDQVKLKCDAKAKANDICDHPNKRKESLISAYEKTDTCDPKNSLPSGIKEVNVVCKLPAPKWKQPRSNESQSSPILPEKIPRKSRSSTKTAAFEIKKGPDAITINEVESSKTVPTSSVTAGLKTTEKMDKAGQPCEDIHQASKVLIHKFKVEKSTANESHIKSDESTRKFSSALKETTLSTEEKKEVCVDKPTSKQGVSKNMPELSGNLRKCEQVLPSQENSVLVPKHTQCTNDVSSSKEKDKIKTMCNETETKIRCANINSKPKVRTGDTASEEQKSNSSPKSVKKCEPPIKNENYLTTTEKEAAIVPVSDVVEAKNDEMSELANFKEFKKKHCHEKDRTDLLGKHQTKAMGTDVPTYPCNPEVLKNDVRENFVDKNVKFPSVPTKVNNKEKKDFTKTSKSELKDYKSDCSVETIASVNTQRISGIPHALSQTKTDSLKSDQIEIIPIIPQNHFTDDGLKEKNSQIEVQNLKTNTRCVNKNEKNFQTKDQSKISDILEPNLKLFEQKSCYGKKLKELDGEKKLNFSKSDDASSKLNDVEKTDIKTIASKPSTSQKMPGILHTVSQSAENSVKSDQIDSIATPNRSRDDDLKKKNAKVEVQDLKTDMKYENKNEKSLQTKNQSGISDSLVPNLKLTEQKSSYEKKLKEIDGEKKLNFSKSDDANSKLNDTEKIDVKTIPSKSTNGQKISGVPHTVSKSAADGIKSDQIESIPTENCSDGLKTKNAKVEVRNLKTDTKCENKNETTSQTEDQSEISNIIVPNLKLEEQKSSYGKKLKEIDEEKKLNFSKSDDANSKLNDTEKMDVKTIPSKSTNGQKMSGVSHTVSKSATDSVKSDQIESIATQNRSKDDDLKKKKSNVEVQNLKTDTKYENKNETTLQTKNQSETSDILVPTLKLTEQKSSYGKKLNEIDKEKKLNFSKSDDANSKLNDTEKMDVKTIPSKSTNGQKISEVPHTVSKSATDSVESDQIESIATQNRSRDDNLKKKKSNVEDQNLKTDTKYENKNETTLKTKDQSESSAEQKFSYGKNLKEFEVEKRLKFSKSEDANSKLNDVAETDIKTIASKSNNAQKTSGFSHTVSQSAVNSVNSDRVEGIPTQTRSKDYDSEKKISQVEVQNLKTDTKYENKNKENFQKKDQSKPSDILVPNLKLSEQKSFNGENLKELDGGKKLNFSKSDDANSKLSDVDKTDKTSLSHQSLVSPEIKNILTSKSIDEHVVLNSKQVFSPKIHNENFSDDMCRKKDSLAESKNLFVINSTSKKSKSETRDNENLTSFSDNQLSKEIPSQVKIIETEKTVLSAFDEEKVKKINSSSSDLSNSVISVEHSEIQTKESCEDLICNDEMKSPATLLNTQQNSLSSCADSSYRDNNSNRTTDTVSTVQSTDKQDVLDRKSEETQTSHGKRRERVSNCEESSIPTPIESEIPEVPKRQTSLDGKLKFKHYRIDDFQLLKLLGKGSFGKVLLVQLKNSSLYFAMKCLRKDDILEDDDVESTMIERRVLALGTQHPFMCKLYCTFQTESHLCFVMEYLKGGDLMFHIQELGRFDENRTRFYGAQIVSALKFLHKKGIIYRDIKLDNVMLDEEGNIRLVDFGMCQCRIYKEECMPSNFCGTPVYIAPEIIEGVKYNQSVDWWSLGILIYEMLTGKSPFNGTDEDELFWCICHEEPIYPLYLSKQAKSILQLLLIKCPENRMGMKSCSHGDITAHEFFSSVNWNLLEAKQLKPPFKPSVKHASDTRNFDTSFTTGSADLTPIDDDALTSMDQNQFRGFSYTNPQITD